MRKVLPALLSFALALLAAPASAWGGIPEALTSHGKIAQDLLSMIMIMGIVMFMIVFVWLVVVVVRFREGSGHGRATHEKERHSLKAELTWTFIPLILVLYIGYAAYGGLVQLDHGIDPKDAKVEIHITASQWDWAADYGNEAHAYNGPGHEVGDAVVIHSSPDPNNGNVAPANVFWVPADTPIFFNITSSDVIHAWQVLDANRAYVMFVDANPLGANKYNQQVVSLPVGDYLVQCNKMCSNPGHAYMHAGIRAVSKPMYDMWLLHHRLAVLPPKAAVVADYDITVTASGLSLIGNQTVIGGSRIILNVTNPTNEAASVTWDGAPFRSVTASGFGPTTVSPHSQAFFLVDPLEARTFVLGVDAGSHSSRINFIVVNGLQAKVELGHFALNPNHLNLEVGKTYLIQVTNVHDTVHNLYIGRHGGDATVLAHSEAVTPGGVLSFPFTPTAAGEFEMWCNIPGHYDLGMHGTVTIT